MQVALSKYAATHFLESTSSARRYSHRSHQKMQAERDRFVGGAMHRPLTEPDADELFPPLLGLRVRLRPCHGRLRQDHLRHRLAEAALPGITTPVLNNQPMGFIAVVVGDAKRHGVKVLSVDVNESAWEHDTRPLPDGSYALRLGMRQVKGIDESSRETLERERASGPYTGVRDFVARTGLGEQVVERLIAIGAFDWTDAPRRELLWQLRTTMEDANPARPALGLTDDAQRALGASLPPMTFAEKVAAEYRELAMAPSAHAVELFRERLAARGVIQVAEAGRRRDRSMVRLAGLAVSVQHPMTAKNFVFIALEDETGMINVTVQPEIYQANRAVLHRHPLLVIDGTLQVEGEVLNVVARLHPVDAVVNEEARQTRLPLGKQQRMFR